MEGVKNTKAISEAGNKFKPDINRISNQKSEKELFEEVSSSDEEKAIPEAETKQAEIQDDDDPNIVNWDGPADPDMALNWPARKKWIMTLLLSSLTLLTYAIASTLMIP